MEKLLPVRSAGLIGAVAAPSGIIQIRRSLCLFADVCDRLQHRKATAEELLSVHSPWLIAAVAALSRTKQTQRTLCLFADVCDRLQHREATAQELLSVHSPWMIAAVAALSRLNRLTILCVFLQMFVTVCSPGRQQMTNC